MLGIQDAWHGLLVALVGAPGSRERGGEEVHVAVALQQTAPLAEVGHVHAVDQGPHILLQQHLRAQMLHGHLGAPQYGTACAAAFLDALTLAGLAD